MSEYKTLFGKAVKALASDPTDAGAEGQIWYNTTTDSFRTVLSVGSWSSGGSLGTARYQISSSHIGVETAALIAGGRNNPPGGAQVLNNSEQYDGSSWSAETNLPSVRGVFQSGVGTATAGLVWWGRLSNPIPGAPTTNTSLHYDGSSWTAGGNLPSAGESAGCGGTQTAAFSAGGENVPGSPTRVITSEYNGSTWTAGGDLNTGRAKGIGFGTQTAGVMAVGQTAAPATILNDTEEYNGTAWTSVNNMVTPQQQIGGNNSPQTDGFIYGGGPDGPNVQSFKYNGTTWSTAPNLVTARYSQGGAGNSGSSALAYGGSGAPASTATEEFTTSIYSPIAATWTSGGNLPAPVSANQGAGTQTAALSISGQPTAPGTAATTATNEYDGSAWTAGGSLAAGAASYGGASATKGSQTASLFWGGYNPTPPPAGFRTTVSSYDGSSWTAQSPFPGFSTTGYASGAGTENAALGMGGYLVTNTYESDASYNWTAGGALPQARYATAAGGPQTAAISAGGFGGSPVVIQNNADTYDGSSWTAISVTPISYAQKNGCFGTDSSDFVVAGGESNRADTIAWDGISWSTTTSLSTGRQGGSGAGASGSIGLLSGGQNPSFTNVTEEFTGEIPALNYKTLTSS